MWEASGKYSIRSMYRFINQGDPKYMLQLHIWKTKVPLKD